MDLKLVFSVGKKTDFEWPSVYGYRSDVTTDMESFEIYAVINVNTKAKVNNIELISKNFFEDFQEIFTKNSNEKDYIKRIEDAFWKVKARIELLLSKEPEVASKGLDLEVCLGVRRDDILYVGVVGDARALVCREDKIVDITDGLIDISKAGFVKTGSIKLKPKDIIGLLTSKALKKIDTIREVMLELTEYKLKDLNDLVGSSVIILGSELLDWKEIPPVVPNPKELPIEPIQKEITLLDIESKGKPNEIVANKVEIQKKDLDQKNLKEIKKSAGPNIKNFFSKINSFRNKMSIKFKAKNDSKEQEVENFQEYEFPDFNEPSLKEIEDLGYVEKNHGSKIIMVIKNISNSILSVIQAFFVFIKKNDKTYIKIVKDFFNTILRFIKWIILVFKREVIGIVDRRNYYRSETKIKRNRIIFSVVTVLLILFLVAQVNSSNRQRYEDLQLTGLMQEVDSLKARFEELDKELLTNTSIDQRNSLALRLETLNNDVLKSKKIANNLVEEIKKGEEVISSITQLELSLLNFKDRLFFVTVLRDEDVELVKDISQEISNAKLTDISFSNSTVFVTDQTNNSIYTISLNGEMQEITSGLLQPFILVKEENGNIIYYDNSTDSAIGRIYVNEIGRIEKIPGLSFTEIGKVTSAGMYYGNGALYELRTSPNPYIFKRDKAGTGFVGGGANYVTINPPNWRSDPDFSSALDIAVPYEIYVLIPGQGIKRYLAGGDNDLSFAKYKNLLESDYKAMEKASSFDVKIKFMAVSDPNNRRIMVFSIEDTPEKNLIFTKQFVYRGERNFFSGLEKIHLEELQTGGFELYFIDSGKVIKVKG